MNHLAVVLLLEAFSFAYVVCVGIIYVFAEGFVFTVCLHFPSSFCDCSILPLQHFPLPVFAILSFVFTCQMFEFVCFIFVFALLFEFSVDSCVCMPFAPLGHCRKSPGIQRKDHGGLVYLIG